MKEGEDMIGTNGEIGKQYIVTLPHNNQAETSNVSLVHVWGTPYQMGTLSGWKPHCSGTTDISSLSWGLRHNAGFAQGQLMKNQISQVATKVWTYLEKEIAKGIAGYIPIWLADLIANLGKRVTISIQCYFGLTSLMMQDWLLPWILPMRPHTHGLAAISSKSSRVLPMVRLL